MPRPPQVFNVNSELDNSGLRFSLEQKPGVVEDAYALSTPQDWDTAELNVQLGNTDLPVHEFREKIVAAVAENPVTIIVAETGSGKTTQVPQMLLEAGYSRINITQPRRVAAKGAYSRTRDEISEVRGLFAGEDLTSFRTAVGGEGPDDAVIRFVTDGLQLVEELHDRGTKPGEVLILDEVHEWNANVEVLVAYAKRELLNNPDSLKTVIMSATIHAEHLADYFSEVCSSPPPIIEIPGRVFNVERREEPESTVIDEVLSIVSEISNTDERLPEGPNGILVFQPGKREIQDTISALHFRMPPEIRKRVKVFPLHAKLSPHEQRDALIEYPDCIKIVVATDVAQTSLTIPDIKYVVDSGYQRRIEVDSEGTKGLMLNPISRADSRQREGRTGRVGHGVYILTRLNASTDHVEMKDRDEYPLPEILRTDIARNMLRLKALEIDIAQFDMYHKASRQIIELANVNLVLLDALDDNGSITPLGEQMNQYPLCTSSARIMVESQRYRESVRGYLAAITASKEMGGLQYFAQNVGRNWQELTEETTSDMLVQLDLFIASQGMNLDDIKYYDLDVNNIQRAHEQYVKIAKIAGASGGILESPSLEDREDIMHCLYTGFLTSIYKHMGDGLYVHAFNDSMPTARELSNRSLVDKKPDYVVGDPYCVERIDGDERVLKHYIENVSAATVHALGAAAKHKIISKPDPEEYKPREGKFYQSKRQHLFGIDLGLLPLEPADPSPQLREEIVKYVIDNPGSELKRLRQTKRELERLAHIAKDHVPQLTHNQILNLIQEATPSDITTPSAIEDNLRIMRLDPSRGLQLHDFVSQERYDEIIRNAPPTIEIEGREFRVKYRSKLPIVQVSSLEAIAELEANEVFLEDGREVMFMHVDHNGRAKKYSLGQLKYRIPS